MLSLQPHKQSEQLMMMDHFISLTLITLICFGNKTGKVIELLEMMEIATIADSLNQITGMVPNNADSHGNAEELELAKEVDGALDMTDVFNLHFQCKLQVFFQIAELLINISLIFKHKIDHSFFSIFNFQTFLSKI